MGGSDGLFGGDYNPDRYRDILKRTSEEARDSQYETTVNDLLSTWLSESIRDSAVTEERLEKIREVLEREDIGSFDILFGGSVKTHTYVEGLSDVDTLLCINRTDLVDLSPDEIKEYLKSKLEKANLRDFDDVRVGDLAITITYSNGDEIQLLPTIRKGECFRIPKEGTNGWSNVVRPDKFAKKLSEINLKNGKGVVPVIKMAKGIMGQLPPNQQISGYHLESIAIEVFKTYPSDAPKTRKAMLEYLFEKGNEIVKTPIKDKTGQSIHVDDDLGISNSPARMQVSYLMSRIGKKMKNADLLGMVDSWESILGINS